METPSRSTSDLDYALDRMDSRKRRERERGKVKKKRMGKLEVSFLYVFNNMHIY